MFARFRHAGPPALALLISLAQACNSSGSGGTTRDDAGLPARDAAQTLDAAQTHDAGQTGDAASEGAVCPVEGYEACAGELAGTWTLAGLCPEAGEGPPCENPFDGEPACTGAGNSVTCQLLAEGSMTFTEAEVHVLRNASVEARYTFSADCLAAIRPEPPDTEARCADLSRPPALACSFGSDVCTCLGRTSAETIDDTAPFTVDGAAITIDGELTATYCVDSARLTLDFDPHPASWRYWVLTR